MAAVVVSVELIDKSSVTHAKASKWVIDEDRNLVVLGSDSKAVAIYAAGQWVKAEVAA
jgi:hypothetical protein